MVFRCISCAFVSDRKSNYDKHNNSKRHALKINATKLAEVRSPEAEVSQPIQAVALLHKCKVCGQCYRHKSSLCKHVKYSCNKNKNDLTVLVQVLHSRLIKQEQKLENQNTRLETQSKQIEELKRGK